MATVQVFTKNRMLAIENASVVGGTVNAEGNLILTRKDGTTINAGDVKRLVPGRIAATNNLGSGNDPSTLIETGWYSGFGWIGALSGFSIGTLEVVQYSPDWITQIFTTVENVPRMYVRSRYNGTTWGTFIQVITKDILDSTIAAVRSRNQIINGNFRANQREYVSGGTLGSGAYFFDRWKSQSPLANMVQDPSFEGPVGKYIANGCTIDIADATWAAVGTKSYNLYNSTSADSFIYVEGDAGAIRLGMKVSKTYVISATANVKAVTTGDIAAESEPTGGTRSRARAIVVHVQFPDGSYSVYKSLQAPNVVETATRLSVEVPIAPNAIAAFVRLYLGATGGQIRWDALRVTEKNAYPEAPVADAAYVDGTTNGASWVGLANSSVSTWGGPAIFTAAPQGQIINIPTRQVIAQIIERANIEEGTYKLSWNGTATGRVYNVGATPPAYLPMSATWSVNGLQDVIVEFTSGTLSKVQLETGTYVTPFEVIPVGLELALCQRYYLKFVANSYNTFGTGQTQSAGVSAIHVSLPVTMRAAPTIDSFSNLIITDRATYDLTVTTLFSQASGKNGVYLYTNHAASASTYRPCYLSVGNGLIGSLGFNAEL